MPDRLRYAASRFRTLQGLYQVTVGVMMLFMIPALNLNNAWTIWLILLLFILLGIASWRIRIYHERRFGHVEGRTRPGFWASGQPLIRRWLFWFPAILVCVISVKVFNLSISIIVGSSLGLLFVGLFVTENRPWYYLLFALPFFVLAVLGRPPHCGLLIEVWLMPVAFIVTGILDHLLLVRSLPGVRSNGAASS